MTQRNGGVDRAAVSTLLLRFAALLVLLAVWGGLVVLAIAAGSAATDGDALAWVWLGLASLGAVAALAAAFVASGRLLRAEVQPRGGKHR